MRHILATSLLLLPSLFPAAALATQPADDSSIQTPAPRISTGVTGPSILNASKVHLSSNVFDRLTPNEATVVLTLNVDEKGKAQDVQVVKSVNKMLDERVISAVRQIQFSPAKLDDQPIPMDMTLNFVVKR
jgi:TonB family protein